MFGAKSGFDIVYPAGSDESKAYANAMAELVVGRKLYAPVVVDDATKTEGQCELLIGDTNRALSTEAKAVIDAKIAEDPYSLHWVWMYKDGQLAIYASSDSAYEKAISEITGKYYSAGSVMVKVNTADVGFFKIAHPVVKDGLVYLFGSTEDFAIVYGDETAAGSFVDALKALGVNASKAVDAEDKDEALCEILIGDTDRALSAEAKSMIQDSTLSRDAWAWVYRDGQLAIYADNAPAYDNAIAELLSRYCQDGVVAIPVDAALEGGSIVHDAYMSYAAYDNFYDGYVDPFGMGDDDYKTMTITRTKTAYEISYKDELGGTFVTTLVERAWGIWAMGGMTYIDSTGKVHAMVIDNTDSEFVLRIGAETPATLRSGNHGNYPGDDDSWKPYEEDDTSKYNDKMLDMTMYDAKTGKMINLTRVGMSVTVSGLRIVMHHNIYEISYKQEHILSNVERSYLYNGYDVMLDTKLYMTQDVKLSNSFSCMLPVYKEYGNNFMFYEDDGGTVYMKTSSKGGSYNEISMGVVGSYIDIWGDDHTDLHLKVQLNNPEDQLRDSVEGSTDKGYIGVRDMSGGGTNKVYCSLFSAEGEMAHGESLHFNSTWSFSYEPDFVAPDREPDRTVGYD